MRTLSTVALCFCLSAAIAPAATISFVGDLRTDCDFGCDTLASDGEYAQFAAVLESFTLAAPSSAVAVTFSYGGGANGNGTIIPAGGFEPYLSLFDNAGNFLASTLFGETCPAGAGFYQGSCYDVKLDMGALAAGTYQIAISAYMNLSLAENNGPPSTLSDGFTGLGNLWEGEDLHYAFDVIIRDGGGPEIPEPSTWLLAAAGLACLRLFKPAR